MAKWDAVIIGGGLAGGAAATLLARAGRRVLLLEKEPQPTHKVCGEFISIEAQTYLVQLGLDIPALGALPIEQLILSYGGQSITRPLPFTAQSLSRFVLDRALLHKAADSGASVRYGQAVTALRRQSSTWQVEIAGGESIVADTIMLATGKHELRGWSRPAAAHSDLIGLKVHLTMPPGNLAQLAGKVQLCLFRDGYAGLELIEADQANLCLVVSKSAFAQHNKDWHHLLASVTAKSAQLRSLLAGATPCWQRPLAIFGIPYGYVFQDHGNTSELYRLGDQMAVIPSLCGDGMAIALHTAFCAVAAYLQGQGSAAYHGIMHAQLKPQIAQAMRLSRLALSPLLQPVLILLCHIIPSLTQRLTLQTRLHGKLITDPTLDFYAYSARLAA